MWHSKSFFTLCTEAGICNPTIRVQIFDVSQQAVDHSRQNLIFPKYEIQLKRQELLYFLLKDSKYSLKTYHLLGIVPCNGHNFSLKELSKDKTPTFILKASKLKKPDSCWGNLRNKNSVSLIQYLILRLVTKTFTLESYSIIALMSKFSVFLCYYCRIYFHPPPTPPIPLTPSLDPHNLKLKAEQPPNYLFSLFPPLLNHLPYY